MGYYGGPELGIEYTFVAVAPLDAEHPLGSGIVMHYAPGETFPGEDWGNAAHNLVEMGKAVRLAVNVKPAGGTPVPPPAAPEPELDPVAETLASYEGEWPAKGGGGWFTLSNGERVRGEEAALAAQRHLDEEEE